MGSLQVRLPLIAIGILALSLAASAFIVFEVVLLGSQGRLDDSIEGGAFRLRDLIAVAEPGALGIDGEGGLNPPPTADDLLLVVDRFLAQEDRNAQHMAVVRLDGRVLTTNDAPSALELLRESNRLPAYQPGEIGEVTTVSTTNGDVRLTGFPLLVADDPDASVVVIGSLSEVRSKAFVALGRVSAVAAIGLLLAGVLLALSIRRTLRPLHELATAARGAELEHLSGRVELGSRSDEIGQLAREFNRMLGRLEESVHEQRRFMAAVSHELRTPITIARGHLELLGDSSAPDFAEQASDTVGLVSDELLRMQRLVADLMALGRVEDDDFVITERVGLRDFLDELLLRIVGLGTQNVVVEPAEDLTFLVDRDRLAQALLNLIVNAEVHAEGRHTIHVSTNSDDDGLAFSVTDDGAGVDESILDRIFEPFVKSENARGSTGLGLSVVAAIAEAHGGTAAVDSGAHGTTVTIRLPESAPIVAGDR